MHSCCAGQLVAFYSLGGGGFLRLVVLSFVGCIEQVRPTHILTTHKHWDHAGTAHTGTDQARPSASTLRYVFTLRHCCGLRRSLCPSARALRPQLGTGGTRGIVGRALRRSHAPRRRPLFRSLRRCSATPMAGGNAELRRRHPAIEATPIRPHWTVSHATPAARTSAALRTVGREVRAARAAAQRPRGLGRR